ncbi:hypothetical protein V1525DRAFT_133078 [Lipomyces kononenkoae]|uniref:Uncharacterized protein n=1 Tax=Lipomyces kononenkoae TaxID=34357 RepID=A0ACC3T1U8_LIPKO
MTISPFLIAQFRKSIWHALDNALEDTALFAAERLVAEDPSDLDNVHLLALCNYRAQRYKIAMHVAEDKRHIGCAYVYALCCLKLGKYRVGYRVLERCRALFPKTCNIYSHSDSDRQALPDLAAVECLLGHLYRLFGDTKEAADNYTAALSANPFLWEAFDGLCKVGVNIKVNNIFMVTPAMKEARTTWLDNADDLTGIENSQNQDPFIDTSAPTGNSVVPGINIAQDMAAPAGADTGIQPLKFRADNSIFSTRIHSAAIDQTPTAGGNDPDVSMLGTTIITPAANTPAEFARPARSRSRLHVPDPQRRTGSSRTTSSSSSAPAADVRRQGAEAPTRRSSRLVSSSNFTPTTTTAAATQTPTSRLSDLARTTNAGSTAPLTSPSAIRGRLRSGLLKTSKSGSPADDNSSSNSNSNGMKTTQDEIHHPIKIAPDDNERVTAEMCMLSLYQTLATAAFALSKYDCKGALQALMSLSDQQKESPWVLSKFGRAYFEIVRYKESEEAFKRLRVVDPMRLEDMEVYSTLLWHLRRDVELSFVAHELADIDRNSAQTWIAIGNSFSLQKEHDQSIKCFRRAAHLDPTFAYAYTLQGHEHAANEEYEAAQNAFRHAMRAEWRHYNAWYGIGMVFLKTGKFELAEQHFRQAAVINPGNAVLTCCIGMVLEKLYRFDDALEQYDTACRLQPTSALPRFKKARLLMSMRRYQACLQELQIVQNLAPDESSVHYLLGRLYKVQGDKQNAIKYFTAALNLDPKASHVIKEAIEGLENDDGSS